MQIVEIKKQSEAFQRGYFDAYAFHHQRPAYPNLPTASDRGDYHAGRKAGLADWQNGR
jgi:hypothetical protein